MPIAPKVVTKTGQESIVLRGWPDSSDWAVAVTIGPVAGLVLTWALLSVAGAMLLRRRNLALPA
jgi:hypothetical protein